MLSAAQSKLLTPCRCPVGFVFRSHLNGGSSTQRSRCIQQLGSRSMQHRANKGFGSETTDSKDAIDSPSTSTSSSISTSDSSIEALEDRLRGKRRRAKVEAKVKVVSPVVDAVSGKTPATPQSQAEATFVFWLFILFCVILVEGLLLAGSGFLPEEADVFITDKLYPNYSWVVLGFLGLSSLYGLYKIGKLPGMTPTK